MSRAKSMTLASLFRSAAHFFHRNVQIQEMEKKTARRQQLEQTSHGWQKLKSVSAEREERIKGVTNVIITNYARDMCYLFAHMNFVNSIYAVALNPSLFLSLVSVEVSRTRCKICWKLVHVCLWPQNAVQLNGIVKNWFTTTQNENTSQDRGHTFGVSSDVKWWKTHQHTTLKSTWIAIVFIVFFFISFFGN